MNVSLIVYATVEMHESDRVMQQFRYIFRGTFIPSILRPHANVDADANAEPNANANTIFDGETEAIINTSINSDTEVSGFCDIIWLFLDHLCISLILSLVSLA
ncbi:hypothetical protein PVK06_033942 [Gossypium arboreum]|uniref:Uncharacterized protein n=1 Tax=Gossypium arboreum TaxID=29729 RepID=A0ABR0ND75_GOSAR|nr:hypothetical protein PVK06_033942 [Gossypium arboreum]